MKTFNTTEQELKSEFLTEVQQHKLLIEWNNTQIEYHISFIKCDAKQNYHLYGTLA